MNPILRQVAGYAVRKLAADPKLRAKAVKAARAALEEGQRIAGDEDRARAAGRAVRRALDKLQSSR